MRKGVPPEVFEWAFTLAAIAFLVWQSEAFREAEFVRGAGDRYRKAVELRAPIEAQAGGTDRVADLCGRYGGWLPKSERESTATRTGVCAQDSHHAIPLTPMGQIRPATLAELTKARDALDRSLAQPVKAKLARLDELENRAREARAEADVHGAIDGIAGETRVYRETYGIATAGARSVPLDCAWNHLDAKYNSPDATESGAVYALLGMAAILDGDPARASAAASPADEAKADTWSKAERETACPALGQPRQVITQAAEIVATARASASNAGKSLAAQDLLANAHWVFAAWAVAGLVLLQVGRLGLRARFFLPLAALVWAATGWATRVHLEWLSDRAAQTAALLKYGVEGGKVFQALAIAAALVLIAGVLFRGKDKTRPLRQTPSSRIGYAGFVLFTGLGWWLLLDLSASGHYANRFHALYQQAYVFAAFVMLTMLSPLRLRLADRVGRWFGVFMMLTKPRGAGLRRYLPWLTYIAAVAVVLGAASVTKRSQTQLTSEIFRLWLVFGASWFFLVRGETALAVGTGARNSGFGGRMRGFVFLLPLAFILCVPVAGFILTDDFGPLDSNCDCAPLAQIDLVAVEREDVVLRKSPL